MNATTQLGEVTSLKTGTRLRRLSVNVWKFGRTTARPVFSLSAFKPCVEILPARIGMVFGSSWKRKDVYEKLRIQKHRNCCGGYSVAKRLASRKTPYSFR